MQLEYLCCPDCGGSLDAQEADAIVCVNCRAVYPQVAGIPDLRWPRDERDTTQDPLVDQLLIAYPKSSLAEMAALIKRQSVVSPQLISHYVDYMLDLERGTRIYNMFAARWQAIYGDLSNKNGLALDLGCGTGKGIFALAANHKHVIGLDPDLSSLILAKKLLESHKTENVTLAQGHAQHLPLKSNSVAWCHAQNVLDHLFQVSPALQEVRRVLQPGSAFCADSHNRYDLFFKEPHVKIRWVGWLPRSLMAWYVRMRTGESYEGIYLLSLWDLKRALNATFEHDNYQVTLPDVAAYGYSAAWDRVVNLIGRIPLISFGLLATFPSHLVLAQKGSAQTTPTQSDNQHSGNTSA
jgi:ubiquinone/menaquinone biosynthesis C-methylase UbiE/uncharacterized protein YbaR (Trm112 family)